MDNNHAEQKPQNPDAGGDNYSNIDIRRSTGTAIGRGANSRVTTYGVDGKELEREFLLVNELIDRLDDTEYDKPRLKYVSADLQEELAKTEPDSNFIARCWEKLKDIGEMSSLLLPAIQQFLQHGQNG